MERGKLFAKLLFEELDKRGIDIDNDLLDLAANTDEEDDSEEAELVAALETALQRYDRAK